MSENNDWDIEWEPEFYSLYSVGGRPKRPTTNAFGSPVTVSSAGSNLDSHIPNFSPHYTDKRFQHAQLIWGRDDAKDIHWNYSDRLSQWDYRKNQESWDKAKADGFKPGTARFYQAYLSNYEGKPIELVGIMSGYNWGNGFPYQVFGYRVIEE